MADVITTLVVNGTDVITYDVVHEKVFEIFADPEVSEKVFKKVRSTLEKEHEIFLDPKVNI